MARPPRRPARALPAPRRLDPGRLAHPGSAVQPAPDGTPGVAGRPRHRQGEGRVHRDGRRLAGEREPVAVAGRRQELPLAERAVGVATRLPRSRRRLAAGTDHNRRVRRDRRRGGGRGGRVAVLRGLAEERDPAVPVPGETRRQQDRATLPGEAGRLARVRLLPGCEVGGSHLVELHHTAGGGTGAAGRPHRRPHADRQREPAGQTRRAEATAGRVHAGADRWRCHAGRVGHQARERRNPPRNFRCSCTSTASHTARRCATRGPAPAGCGTGCSPNRGSSWRASTTAAPTCPAAASGGRPSTGRSASSPRPSRLRRSGCCSGGGRTSIRVGSARGGGAAAAA